MMNKDPLETLLNDPTVSEILINDFDKIYFESNGRLQKHAEYFSSAHNYLMYIEGLCEKLHRPLNREQPFLEMNLNNRRYSLIFGELSSGVPLLSIRKQVINSLTLESLVQSGWCGAREEAYVKNSVQQKKNF